MAQPPCFAWSLYICALMFFDLHHWRVDIVLVVGQHSPNDINQPTLYAFYSLAFGLALAHLVVVVFIKQWVHDLAVAAIGHGHAHGQFVYKRV